MKQNESSIYYIDSFCLKSSHIKREHQNKTLKIISGKGKRSVDWFFGMKLHLITNSFKQLVNWKLTPGNISDNNQKLIIDITKNISGRFFGN